MAKQEIKIPEDQLDALILECSKALADEVKQMNLTKAESDDAPSEESEGSSGPAKAAPKDKQAPSKAPSAPAEKESAPASASAPEAPPAEAAPEAPEAAPEAPSADEAAAAAPGTPEHEQGEIEPATTVEELQAEYMNLDPEALKMHFLAAKAALVAAMGADQSQADAPMAPPAPAPEAPLAMAEKSASEASKEASSASASSMDKKEMSAEKSSASSSEESSSKSSSSMAKSEKDVKIEELEAQLKLQTEEVAKLAQVLETPIRKSIKNISDLKFIEKTDANKAPVQMTTAQAKAKLTEKLRDGKLSKSDKELFMKFSCGSIDISKVEHLLTETAPVGK